MGVKRFWNLQLEDDEPSTPEEDDDDMGVQRFRLLDLD
jgi:hypothetical protein